MSIRKRIFLALICLIGAGFYFLVTWVLNDLKPHYREAVEESLADTANLLAEIASTDTDIRALPARFRTIFTNTYARRLDARIYQLQKTDIDLRIYLTDAHGIVLFDSTTPTNVGRDFSQWRDVALTLQGRYGSRTSRDVPEDPTTTVMYVAAPIYSGATTAGVVTVGKPTKNINRFIAAAGPTIQIAGSIVALIVIMGGIAMTAWITRPIRRLTEYARAVRDGRRVPFPRLGRNEIGALGTAFEEMREALEGKQYVEQYVQSLTHELKSPLAAIRGAAELLTETMPKEQQSKFLANIRTETTRTQQIVERLLDLAILEHRHLLQSTEDIDLVTLAHEAADSASARTAAKQLRITIPAATVPAVCRGDRFLLRQAMDNLVHNAIDFSPRGGTITLGLSAGTAGTLTLCVADEGPGIPAYALPRVFDRFFSLQRPDTGQKSSGLGLCFVQEIMVLHGGSVRLENIAGRGFRACLVFP